MSITVTITETSIVSKVYEADELRALIHAKGGQDSMVAEFVADQRPYQVMVNLTVGATASSTSSGPTWTVEIDGEVL